MWPRRIAAGITTTAGALCVKFGGVLVATSSYFLGDRLLSSWHTGLPLDLGTMKPVELAAIYLVGLLLCVIGALAIWKAAKMLRECREKNRGEG